MDYYKMLLEFIGTFLILYILYYFFIIKKCKKNKDYVPTEVNIILILHKIDYRKIELYKMVKMTSIITVFVISFIITIISNYFDNTLIVIMFGTVVSILISIICYNYIGYYFKKKSKIKHK